VPECWVMAAPQPNHHLDITDTFDAKIQALRAHKSQTSHMDDLEDRIRGWGLANAVAGALPEGRLAEAYRVLATG
jgi:LmbE family N-acetylglucosaminyl deacetylase